MRLSADNCREFFPFHLLVDRSMTIVQAGKVIRRLVPKIDARPPVTDVFKITSPSGADDFAGIERGAGEVFVLEGLENPRLRMNYGVVVTEENQALFIGGPIFDSLEKLTGLGLTLEDFQPYDQILTHVAALEAQKSAISDAAELLSLQAESARITEELRASDARFRDLYDNAPDMLGSTDIATRRIVRCNRALAVATGFAEDEIVGRPLAELYHPDCRNEVDKTFQTFLKTGEVRDVELALLRIDGSKIDVSLNVSAVRDASGKITHCRSAWRDITKRKRAEAALRAAEARLKGILDIAPSAIIVSDESWRVRLFNKGAERIFGHRADRVLGRSLDILVPPRFRRNHSRHREEFARSPEAWRPMGFSGEIVGLKADGTEFPAVAAVSKFELGGEKTFTVVLQDITKRKQADAELERRATQLHAVVENTPVGLAMCDRDKTVLWINERLAAEYGLRPDQAVGRNWLDIAGSAEPRRLAFERVLMGESLDLPNTRWPGHLEDRTFDRSYRPVRDESGEVVGAIIMAVDVTERERAQRQLIQASKLATLGEMATAIAHELNQPLSVIRMSADRAMEHIETGETDRKFMQERLERIAAQVERATATIAHMRVFGRTDASEPEPFDPRNAIKGALSIMGEQLRLKEIEVDLDLPEDCRQVIGHQNQLEQVLINLLTNSRDIIADVKPSPDADGEENHKRIRLCVEDDLQADKVGVVVEDTGGGIPEDIFDRIFEPFFTTKDMEKGTGLGLSISYGIINDMGGTIEAANVAGGARFTIRLPAAGG